MADLPERERKNNVDDHARMKRSTKRLYISNATILLNFSGMELIGSPKVLYCMLFNVSRILVALKAAQDLVDVQ